MRSGRERNEILQERLRNADGFTDPHAVHSLIRGAIECEEDIDDVAAMLSKHLVRSGASLTTQQQADCLAFVTAYVRETPDIMEAAFCAAQRAEVLALIEPIFEAALRYWAEPHNYIPDDLGLIGLVDEAYLTRLFLETISSLHRRQTGGPLFAIDLGSPNRMMRDLIGEPVATQLDAVGRHTVATQVVQAGLQQLSVFTGGLGLGVPNVGRPSYYDIRLEADVRLGAMGAV